MKRHAIAIGLVLLVASTAAAQVGDVSFETSAAVIAKPLPVGAPDRSPDCSPGCSPDCSPNCPEDTSDPIPRARLA